MNSRLIYPEHCGKLVYATLGQTGTVRAAAPVSTTFPTSDMALFAPIYIGVPLLAQQLACVNGATVTGSTLIDVGLYSIDGTRLDTGAGQTTQSGTSATQAFNIADLYLDAGTYYLGLVANKNTTTFEGHTTTLTIGGALFKGLGCAQQQLAGSAALPAVAAFATFATNFVPLLLISGQAVL